MAAKKKTKKIPSELVYGIIGAFIFLLLFVFFSSNKNFVATQNQGSVETKVASKTDTKTLTDFVDSAASLIQKEGEASFKMLETKGSPWWEGDSYIFVYDMDGNTLVLPPQKDLEGTNRLYAKDSNGVYFVKEMVDALQTKNSGWIMYEYPKPGTTEPSEKLSYFKKVKMGDKTVLIGSGIYLQ